MMSSEYDIVIVGAGPAGATLARLLAPKFKVACVDKKRLDGGEGFSKPCGGLLSPSAQKSLARFGLTLPLSLLADPQVFCVKTIDLQKNITRHYQRHYLNTDRHKFDLWLMSLIEGAALFDNAQVTGVARGEDGLFSVDFRRNGENTRLHAKYLVGADGAASVVRKNFFKTKIRAYTAIQKWYKGPLNTDYCCFFDPRITDCYAWSEPKGDYTIIGAALPVKHSAELFDRLIAAIRPHGFDHPGEPVKTEACVVLRPKNARQFAVERNGVFLIGEAAGFISPSSLEGISLALDSARLLAESFDSSDPARAYRRASRKLRVRVCSRLLRVPFMYWPWLRKLVMRSGLTSIKVDKKIPHA